MNLKVSLTVSCYSRGIRFKKIDDEYRTKDLAAIDVVTVVTSLEAFRNHVW